MNKRQSNFVSSLADEIRKYSKSYGCSLFCAAQDLDEPQTIETMTAVAALLDVPEIAALGKDVSYVREYINERYSD